VAADAVGAQEHRTHWPSRLSPPRGPVPKRPSFCCNSCCGRGRCRMLPAVQCRVRAVCVAPWRVAWQLAGRSCVAVRLLCVCMLCVAARRMLCGTRRCQAGRRGHGKELERLRVCLG
jgi:hypothetical protein